MYVYHNLKYVCMCLCLGKRKMQVLLMLTHLSYLVPIKFTSNVSVAGYYLLIHYLFLFWTWLVNIFTCVSVQIYKWLFKNCTGYSCFIEKIIKVLIMWFSFCFYLFLQIFVYFNFNMWYFCLLYDAFIVIVKWCHFHPANFIHNLKKEK